MKKNVLALSIAAMVGSFAGGAFAGVLPGTGPYTPKPATGPALMARATASELQLSESGKGHLLTVPYYTAQDGNVTVLHVVNTDSANGKALKVRFRGAANSDDVLDFTVFLSPSDVWTGYVTKGADGTASFVTGDTSCVIANDINNGGVRPMTIPFSTERVKANTKWTGDALAAQTREGYVEILNMADIPTLGNPANATVGSTQTPLWNAVKHVAGGKPTCDTAVLRQTTQLWTVQGMTRAGSEEDTAAKLGLNTPTGGLFGDWYIQNVAKTTTYSGSAPAVVAVDDKGNSARGNYTFFSQVAEALPDAPNAYTADPLLLAGSDPLTRQVYDFPDLSTPYTLPAFLAGPTGPALQASQLSSALAVKSVANQYAVDAGISAQTDWTLSMPTRRYALAANYAAIGSLLYPANYVVVNQNVRDLPAYNGNNNPFFGFDRLGSLSIVVPFTVPSNVKHDSEGRLCVRTDTNAFFDREEQQKDNISASPAAVGKVALCGEVSVLSITKDGAGPGVLGASVANSLLKAPYENGWGEVRAYNARGLSGRLPLMGHSFTKLYNPSVAAGTSGNFGITWAHRFDR